MRRKDNKPDLLERISSDNQLSRVHLSLLLVLISKASDNEINTPIRVSRRELMLSSRIKSTATYHKCIKELSSLGYIDYRPSYHPEKASTIILINPKTIEEKGLQTHSNQR